MFVLLPVMVSAQNQTTGIQPTEEALQQRIDSLEERIGELEAAAAGTTEKSPTTLRAFWKECLRLETDDGKFKFKVGGRTALDAAWFSDDSDLQQAFGEAEDGFKFRRNYLYMSGQIHDWVEFKSEYEFAGEKVGFEEVYIGFTQIPYLGRIRFGNVDEPFGLELRTSNRFTVFMERGLTHTLVPGTNTGIVVKNLVLNDHFFFGFGVNRESDYDDYNFTGRLVAIPINSDDGTRLLHLGVAGSHRNQNKTMSYNSRPESNVSNIKYVDTGDIPVEKEDILGLEFAWIHGPLSLQSEYIFTNVSIQDAGDADFSAWYAFIAYSITGESRFYDVGSATFDRPGVNKNFREGGLGAWEVAVRFSGIDLEDDNANGGKEHDLTLGLNWYFNPNAKLMFNYVRAMIDRISYEGDLDIFQMRAQIDF
jgi:phosphate-selective porin OprO/OprP